MTWTYLLPAQSPKSNSVVPGSHWTPPKIHHNLYTTSADI